MDIWFKCEHCGKSLVVDEKGRGYSVNCPDCGTALVVPEASTEQPASEDAPVQPPEAEALQPETPRLQLKRRPEPPQTKPCPYCAEEIAATAIKCKHCGTMLDGAMNAPYAPSNIITERFNAPHGKAERFPRYDEVPWQQQEGVLNFFSGLGVLFVLVGWLFFQTFWMFGIAFLLLLFPSIISISSVVYRKKQDSKGKLLEWNWNSKSGPMVLCLIAFVACISLLLGGGSPAKPVSAEQVNSVQPVSEVRQPVAIETQPAKEPTEGVAVVGTSTVRYNSPVTKAEATRLASYMAKTWDAPCVLTKGDDGNSYIVGVPCNPDEVNTDLLNEIQGVGGEMSEEVFDNHVVTIQLVGKDTQGKITIFGETSTAVKTMFITNNAAVVYAYPVTRAQARAILPIFTPSSIGEGVVNVMSVAKSGDRYQIQIWVPSNSSILSDPMIATRMKRTVQYLASQVFDGDKTELHFCKSEEDDPVPLQVYTAGGD